ncbi:MULTISPECIES: TolC family outer membrane protein [Pseudoalteromonas]|uniref:TolC family outer membrane protein n=1 Tax=Pseudoalteromonas TaxID=53246 RepID=UPI0016028B55|nr:MULTISPECIES: TolC family outer membrane protein [unclassified Pseudoalteromonas]MBB1298824.1 TolC family outer membrane protein [Pseudoalteromonas sp. SR41-7]MBB1345162.1 TolC family outer membrane protein [Pseudoalteromonas sp. SG45-2]MBB1351728.1 TolC family outer membrane protein [Pseudoalteromonas sp. SG45-3]MBB1359696.1 TolC family outer membrane protein [Pseudoalteromonas sp. SG45-6]MBB1430509.1 TolC family outer membrane protein [Pseudoalteromonas sp. SG43-4]
MRKLGLLSVLALAPGLSNALTLEQSVAETLNTNPRLMQKYASFEAKYRDKRSAFSEYLPQVRLYAGYGYERVNYKSGRELDSELNRREIGLKITQMLFDGFRTSSEVARLDNEAKADQLGLISAAENISLEVVQVYLDLLKSVELVELSERNINIHKKILSDIEQRRQRGLSSDADVAQVQSRLATSQSGFLAAKNNLQDIKANYYDLVGQYPDDLMIPKVDETYIPATLGDAIAVAKKSHPEIMAAVFDIEAANKQIEREKSGYWPKVSLEFDVADNDNISGSPGRDDNGRVMLSMSYDLYNGGKTNADTEAAKWRYQEAVAVKDTTHRQVEEATTFAWNANMFLAEQKGFYEENVGYAEVAQKGYERQFSLGRRSLLDVLDSQIELFTARRNYIESAYDQRKASFRLVNATGRLVRALRVDKPEAWLLGDR